MRNLLKNGEALRQLGPFYSTNYDSINELRDPYMHKAAYQIYVTLHKLRMNCLRNYKKRVSKRQKTDPL